MQLPTAVYSSGQLEGNVARLDCVRPHISRWLVCSISDEREIYRVLCLGMGSSIMFVHPSDVCPSIATATGKYVWNIVKGHKVCAKDNTTCETLGPAPNPVGRWLSEKAFKDQVILVLSSCYRWWRQGSPSPHSRSSTCRTGRYRNA
jgi:hypothetical protein